MPSFPTEIFVPRDTENLPGVVYDAGDKRTFFSEDFQNLGGEISAIESELESFKTYKALVFFNGTETPDAYILKNNVGDLVWSHPYPATYLLTLEGAFAGKKVFCAPPVVYDGGVDQTFFLQLLYWTDDYLLFQGRLAGNDLFDMSYENYPVEITVYPT